MADDNKKLQNLHLCDPFLPDKIVEWVQGRQEIVAVHNYMHSRVEGHHRHHCRDRVEEEGPVSQKGDGAVMEDMEK